MKKREQTISTIEREATAVIIAIKPFTDYLISVVSTLYSDYIAISNYLSMVEKHGLPASWLDTMTEYEFEIRHVINGQKIRRLPFKLLKRFELQRRR